ncbi:hypothetical protein BS78_K091900 [Paspalum vaginatum]|uniref:Cytochrome P450 n=1 Tax=Paspalum vaginatum TaxID=158149 RepID=A0A9W7X8D9_9POAL|nr:hypothetical protein BS78_K091900 [Paspalum vaginatum]
MVEMGVSVVSVLAVILVPWLWAALVRLVWRPHAVTRAFARQGVRGPPYRFFLGNTGEARAMRAAASGATLDRSSHDVVPLMMPHLHAWTSRYGKVFLWWRGSTPVLSLGRHDMVKQVLADRAGKYVKPVLTPALMAIMGAGLIMVEGDDWARHRRVVGPAFAVDKVVQEWAEEVAAGCGAATVEVGRWFRELTADVISRTAFGSSYRRGKEYLPTRANVRRWQLERKVRATLQGIVDERLAAAARESSQSPVGYGTDLLGLMLKANAAGQGRRAVMTMDEIIDECKTFFFAGHETTAHLLTWSMFLLGTHPEWQRRLRDEVLRECGGAEEVPLHIHGDTFNLNKLKLVTMVLYETLRLYGPISTIERQATADVELCGVQFNPLRFQDGGGGGATAAHPGALMLAFSAGPRSCVGQDMAMLEAKATLALILRRFTFEVSPGYVHAPAGLLAPQVHVVLKLL